MPTPNDPHDKLFKATFSEKDVAIDFIKSFLPDSIQEKIYMESLKLEPVSYVNPTLSGFYSDVVYSCFFGKTAVQIVILFEHKSYIEQYPHLQLLRYMVEAWFQMIGQNETLKPIIPIIFYHGKDSWVYKPFESYFEKLDSSLSAFIPSFNYLLTNIGNLTDNQLEEMHIGVLQQALFLFKHGKDSSYMFHHFQELFRGLEPYSQSNQYTSLIISFAVYILAVSGIPKETFVNLVQSLPTSINEQIMNTYKQIVNEGRIEGRIEGKIEQQNQVIVQGVKNGLSLELISKLADLSLEEVKARIHSLGIEL
ncbi:MAG: Rpn family recombination-promoting nuclease/putative transposase [Bacteroidota bacterium]